MISEANPLASESRVAGKQSRLNYRADSFVRFVHEPCSVVPVFIKDAKTGFSRQLAGYYDTDHLEKLSQDVQQYSGHATGIFYGVNPVWSSCLDRAKNCLKPIWETQATEDSDILGRSMMLIDIDSERDPDCSATQDEKDVAYWIGRIICRDLRKAGWPRPVVLDSGNGYHLLFRVNLPVNDEDLIRDCLKALANRYDCEEAKIDTTVFDAKRFAKLPGTMACKGPETLERPHRLSGYFRLPPEFTAVPEDLLNQLASQAPSKPKQAIVQNQALIQVGDVSRQIANAQAYLTTMPPAISGQNGRNQMLNAACRLVDDFALSAEQARRLLEEYNQRCKPPFDSAGVDDKLSSALAKVDERGGPSGWALTPTSTGEKPNSLCKPALFVGYIPDFGLVDQTPLRSVQEEPSDFHWVWYWLLWSFLRTDVQVPDVLIRQLHWGPNYDKNWKSRLRSSLKHWFKCDEKCSAQKCLFCGANRKHDHYVKYGQIRGPITIFRDLNQSPSDVLQKFDLYDAQKKEAREKLQCTGHLFNVYWPALVLGSSRRVGWSWRQQRLAVGMVRELTRRKPRPDEDIAGEIIRSGLVPAAKNSSYKTVCPLLDPNQPYVAFAGNGRRKGRGYQLVGRTGKGWIHRSGYLGAPRMNAAERLGALNSFLIDLESLRQDLSLIPAAVNKGQWKSLDEMIDCTRTGCGQEWLECCTMRIYAPADWRIRWRRFFSEKLGFEWIPTSPEDSGNSIESVSPRDPQAITSANQIKTWLKEKGWTQRELAEEIESVTEKQCSLRRVQRHLAGESRTDSFFEDFDRVRLKHQEATPRFTEGG